MLDSKHMIIINEDGQETEVNILLTFDSPDGKKKFVLISDPEDPEENVYAFQYNDEGGLEEVSDPEDFKGMYLGSNVRLATDNDGQLVLLFPDEWAVNYFAEKNEDITLIKHSPLQGDTI